MSKTDALIIGYDYNPEKDNTVLIVGRKTVGQDAVDIINAFEGKEAEELYLKLTTKKEAVK